MRTKEMTDLGADDPLLPYHPFHPRWVDDVGGN